MQNVFDSENTPNREPRELVVGDRWAWKRPDISETYSPETYSLKYEFVPLAPGRSKKSITASKQSGEFVVDIANTSELEFCEGEHWLNVVIVRDSDQAQVTIEKFEVLISALSSDGRSYAMRVLDAIRATIEGTATKEQQSYSIAGRSVSRRSIDELLTLEKEFKSRVQAEKKALAQKNGETVSRTTLFKLKA